MTRQLQKAVFPVAGLGTRFLPATKASPKEMLPVVDKPLIQYAVEEAYEAGIRHMIFVTGRSKRSIEDHFDRSFELEHELEAKHKTELLNLVRNIKPAHVNCVYVRQPEALGLGHAVNCAASLVGNEPFAVVLALVLWVLLSSTSHASTCASRTVKTESAPAASYEVDATPIEEVITSHKASVVWTGCPPGAPASGGEWLAYFSSNFGLPNRLWCADNFNVFIT